MGVTRMDQDFGGGIEVEWLFEDLGKGIWGRGESFERRMWKVRCNVVDMEGYGLGKVCKKVGVGVI